MGTKRTAFDANIPLFSNKRRRADDQYQSEGPIDPYSGQRSAFPGLHTYYDDDDQDGEGEDAGDGSGLVSGLPSNPLAYLRGVRSQAASIPHLLVAPKSSSASAEALQATLAGGYYRDGAYIAAPLDTHLEDDSELDEGEIDQDDESDAPSRQSAQSAYTTSMLRRFARLRRKLSSTPPLHLVRTLDSEVMPTRHTEHPAPSEAATVAFWRATLLMNDPSPVQLAAMEQRTVRAIIKALGEVLRWDCLLVRGPFQELGAKRLDRRVGAWCWGILAKMDEAGTLSSEEVAEVRALGKVAVRLLERPMQPNPRHRRRRAEAALGQMDGSSKPSVHSDVTRQERVRKAELGTGIKRSPSPARPRRNSSSVEPEADEESLEAAKARALRSLDAIGDESGETKTLPVQEEDIEASAYATLDMVVTVIGERYGQRDLLTAREASWGRSHASDAREGSDVNGAETDGEDDSEIIGFDAQ